MASITLRGTDVVEVVIVLVENDVLALVLRVELKLELVIVES
ncbi:MAG: hypothetical protein NVS1B11_19090 [Terriglobales bacterium]